MTIGDGARWRRRDDVLWRRSLDAVILLPEGADEPVTLPGTGAAVWDLLEEPATLDELVDALAAQYDADRAAITADVAALLTELESLAAVRFGVRNAAVGDVSDAKTEGTGGVGG